MDIEKAVKIENKLRQENKDYLFLLDDLVLPLSDKKAVEKIKNNTNNLVKVQKIFNEDNELLKEQLKLAIERAKKSKNN